VDSGGLTVQFSGDPDINGGALTSGTLEVTAEAGYGNATVTLDSFTYTPIAVPEASSLSLLALGAAGVVALRRRKAV
jgi:hypothetical protein